MRLWTKCVNESALSNPGREAFAQFAAQWLETRAQ